MIGTGWGGWSVMRPLQASEVQVNWCCHLLHTPWHRGRCRKNRERERRQVLTVIKSERGATNAYQTSGSRHDCVKIKISQMKKINIYFLML